MRITSVHLRNFKRFTDLLIREIPETAKLVILVGPNGCGKSSLFDGLLTWYRRTVAMGQVGEDSYFYKEANLESHYTQNVDVTLARGATVKKGDLYVRTAYRNDPDFVIGGIGRLPSPSEAIRVNRMIDNDASVSENYQRLIYATMSGVYDTSNDGKLVAELREELIGKVRLSMSNVFGDLLLNNIGDPLGNGTFFFAKGSAKSYNYKNLSGGEKAAFDLILDLHVKTEFLKGAVYCIDEMETHLHTRVQAKLIRELVSIIPDEGQLWATTHSLGVLQAAQEMAIEKPGSVCLIDFAGVDADVPCEVRPSSLGRVSWEKVLSVALDNISARIAPKVVVVCEGSAAGKARKDFDAEIYDRILGSHTPNIVFISGGSSLQVAEAGISVEQTLNQIIPTARVVALVDRDDKSSAEVAAFEQRGNLVLSRRNLESFLLDDEVIKALVLSCNKPDKVDEALEIKRQALSNCVERGKPEDDLKSAAGEIWVKLKLLLRFQRAGNTPDAFMRDTLAPLITPSMAVYAEMYGTIIQRIGIMAN